VPLTIKEMRAGSSPRQRNIASLVGGYVIALGCFALFILVASQIADAVPGWPVIAAGAAFAAAVGIWIRLADL
jgi:hypothetical protein